MSHLSALQDLASAVSSLSVDQVDLPGVQGYVKGQCVSLLSALPGLASAVSSLSVDQVEL